MRNLAIIPARSGSKGLADKNIRLLGGKPLIAHSIEAAIASDMFDDVMVSTDSDKYASIAREYGAQVPFLRKAEHSTDSASSWDAVREVLENYAAQGLVFDTVTLLQPTSPLRTSRDIEDGFTVFHNNNADAVVAVCEVDHSPLSCNTLPPDGNMLSFVDEKISLMPRQSKPVFYRVNGALYIRRVAPFAEGQDLYGSKCFAYIMPQKRSIDIDTDLDLKFAEIAMGSDL